MSIQRPTNIFWAFAQRKQSDIFTAISAGNLNKSLPFKEYSNAMLEKSINTDKAYFGKGHDFASRVDRTGHQFRFGRSFDATSESLAWALSLLMGKVTTTGPSGIYYTHEVEFESPLILKECLYTTIIEKVGSEYQNLLSGVFIESVNLSAEGKENLVLALTASARSQSSNATTLPSITKSAAMRSNHATFTFGATGAQTSISEQVTKWNLALANNPDVRWMPGQTSGEEHLIRYALTGNQSVGGSISLFIDATLRAFFLNHTQCGITITCKSVGDVNHQMIIEIPAFQIASEAHAISGQTSELTLNFTEDTIIKDDAVDGSPVRITLVNEIAALLV